VLEILHRQRDAFFPNADVFVVARLKFDQFLTARVAHRGVGCRFCVRLFIDANDLGEWIALERLFIEKVFPTPNHHSKLGAPIADVIVANYVVSKECSDPCQRITQRGATNVTDVHWLGHVRRTEIDHNFLWRCRPRNPQILISKEFARLFCNGIAT
jgi:hypothetical protein